VHLKHFYELGKKSVTAWLGDYAPSMGAAISYYTVFSIAPLLLIVIAVAGFVWGREAVQGEIVGQLSGLIGRDGALGIQALIESAHKPAKGLLATVISLGVLVVGATTVFAELQSALDRVWDVPPAQKTSGIWATLRARLLSLGFILGLGFLLSVSLVISAGLAALGGWMTGLLPRRGIAAANPQQHRLPGRGRGAVRHDLQAHAAGRRRLARRLGGRRRHGRAV
jgi:membrane protein